MEKLLSRQKKALIDLLIYFVLTIAGVVFWDVLYQIEYSISINVASLLSDFGSLAFSCLVLLAIIVFYDYKSPGNRLLSFIGMTLVILPQLINLASTVSNVGDIRYFFHSTAGLSYFVTELVIDIMLIVFSIYILIGKPYAKIGVMKIEGLAIIAIVLCMLLKLPRLLMAIPYNFDLIYLADIVYCVCDMATIVLFLLSFYHAFKQWRYEAEY